MIGAQSSPIFRDEKHLGVGPQGGEIGVLEDFAVDRYQHAPGQ